MAPLDVDPGVTKLTLAEIGPRTFRTESSAPFVEDGDIVVFDLDSRGRASRMTIASERLERVGP
jgi:hypothetical protein